MARIKNVDLPTLGRPTTATIGLVFLLLISVSTPFSQPASFDLQALLLIILVMSA